MVLLADSPDLLAFLEPLGLAAHAERLAPFAHVVLALVAADDPTRPVAARIGGPLEAPPDFTWPTHRWPLAEIAEWPDFALRDLAEARAKGQVRDEDGYLVMPLPFVLQLDCAALAEVDLEQRLPVSGSLAFFAATTTDLEDRRYAKRVAAAVRFIDAAHDRVPTLQPPTPESCPVGSRALRAERRVTFEMEFEQWREFEHALPAAPFAALSESMRCDADLHALFPAPRDEIAGPMPPPGEIALLRIGEDADVEFFVGDAAWLTFVLPEADLAAHCFEAACATVFIG